MRLSKLSSDHAATRPLWGGAGGDRTRAGRWFLGFIIAGVALAVAAGGIAFTFFALRVRTVFVADLFIWTLLAAITALLISQAIVLIEQMRSAKNPALAWSWTDFSTHACDGDLTFKRVVEMTLDDRERGVFKLWLRGRLGEYRWRLTTMRRALATTALGGAGIVALLEHSLPGLIDAGKYGVALSAAAFVLTLLVQSLLRQPESVLDTQLRLLSLVMRERKQTRKNTGSAAAP